MKEKQQASLCDKTRGRMVSNIRQPHAQRASERSSHDVCHKLSNKFILDSVNSIEKPVATNFHYNTRQNGNVTNANSKQAAAKKTKPQQSFYNNSKYFQPIEANLPKENSPTQVKKNQKSSQPRNSARNSPSWNRDCTLSPIFTYYAGARFSNPPSPNEVPKPPPSWLQPAPGSCRCSCSNPCSSCSPISRNNQPNTLLHVPA